MDTFTVVASVVLLAFIAWIVARNLGRGGRGRARRDGSRAGSTTAHAATSGGGERRHDNHEGPGDSGHGDAGGGGGGD